MMHVNPGDHICAIYSSDDELAGIVADFLAEGLRKSERVGICRPRMTRRQFEPR
jgi:hypothetical protein